MRLRQLSCGLVFALAAAASLAQAPTRVRGQITRVEGNTVSVKPASGEATQVALGEKTQLLFMQPIALEDIKPGDFLGVTSVEHADGTRTATEVRRFAKPVSPGDRPFSGGGGQRMTNATVSATVRATAGRELTLSYEGGTRRILVPPSAFVATLVPGERSQLKPGCLVNLTAVPDASGRLTALQIQFRNP